MSAANSIIPHMVGNAGIASPELKNVVMLFMENFKALGGQVADLYQAVIELQEAAASSGGMTQAIATAQNTANTAIANAATAANVAAEASAAASSAQQAVSSIRWSTSFAIVGIGLGFNRSSRTDASDTFPMEALVPNTSASYDVLVKFIVRNGNTTGKHRCVISRDPSSSSSSNTQVTSIDRVQGAMDELSLVLNGRDTLHILNGATSGTDNAEGIGSTAVAVYVKITEKTNTST